MAVLLLSLLLYPLGVLILGSIGAKYPGLLGKSAIDVDSCRGDSR